MMLNTFKRFAQCNIRGIYLKTSGQQLYSSSSNTELAANASAPEQSRPAGPLIKGDSADNEIDIAAGLFDNSSVTHKPGKPAPLQRPKPKEVKPPLSLKNDFVRETEKRHKKKPHIMVEPKLHGRVLYDRTMDMEIIRLERQNDPLITELLTKVRSRKRRDKNSEILIEGHRLIHEALQCGLRMHSLIFSQVQQLRNIHKAVSEAQQRHQTKIYKVGQHDIKTWSTLVTPPGLMAIFQRPDGSGLKRPAGDEAAALPVTVVCDNIREPNNLGSIIRTCAALPCHQVLVTRGCCDPWESKALRGGCGGQFRVRLQDDCDWSQLQGLMPQLEQGRLSVLVAESNVQKAPPQTATVAYSDLEMRGDHCVVIIGGESHGISQEAYDFLASAGQTNGRCVHIPLANGVESLNVTSALTLILYELRRNLQQKLQAAAPPPPEQQN